MVDCRFEEVEEASYGENVPQNSGSWKEAEWSFLLTKRNTKCMWHSVY